MTNRFTREQILARLIIDTAECLACDQEDVTPDASFFNALAGESIELLDLSFRIQKRFGIRANFQDLLGDWQFDANGELSATTIDKLSQKFPSIDWAARVADMPGNDPRELLTMSLIAEILFCSQSGNARGVGAGS